MKTLIENFNLLCVFASQLFSIVGSTSVEISVAATAVHMAEIGLSCKTSHIDLKNGVESFGYTKLFTDYNSANQAISGYKANQTR